MNILGKILSQVNAHNKVIEQDKMWKEKEKNDKQREEKDKYSSNCKFFNLKELGYWHSC